MKRCLLLFWTILSFMYSECQEKKDNYINPDIPLADNWYSVNFIHIDFTGSDILSKRSIKKGEKIGKVASYPLTFSNKYDNEIKQSIDYYNNGKFQDAKNVLEEPLKNESDNKFILNYYAKACYQIDRETSYKIYKKLVNSIDSTYYDPKYQVTIDLWFREAYWKLGTLHMDNNKWEQGYYEISRFLFSPVDMKQNQIYRQALQFLTECSFMLYKDELAEYLAKRTLSYDPDNTYAKDILKKLRTNSSTSHH